MRAAWLASFVLAASLGGCDFFDKGDPPPSVTGRGVGEDCSSASDCRTGLVCDMDRMSCQPAGTAPEGGVCQLTGDCGPDLYCAADRTCSPAGDADEGARCGSTADCLPFGALGSPDEWSSFEGSVPGRIKKNICGSQ